MFESKHARPASPRLWRCRVARSVLAAVLVLGAALAIGVCGYRFVAGQSWVDALLNASMILGGMGPVDPLPNAAAKVFASLYALFSGLLMVGVAGLLLLPWAHRLLHRFHADPDEAQADGAPSPRPTRPRAGKAPAGPRRRS